MRPLHVTAPGRLVFVNICGWLLVLLLTGCSVAIPIDPQYQQTTVSYVEVPIVELVWINPPAPENLTHTVKYFNEDDIEYVKLDMAWEEDFPLLPYEVYMIEVFIIPADQNLTAGYVGLSSVPSKSMVISNPEQAVIFWRVTRRHASLNKEWNFSKFESVQISVMKKVL